jgi:hypothetical protein
MSVNPTPFHVLEMDSDHIKATAFNMLFVVWQRRTLADAARRCVSAGRELGRKYPEGIGMLHVLEEHSVVPDDETRDVLPEVMRGTHIQHFSITYVGSGFRAAAIRAVISATYWIARPAFEYSVYDNLPDATNWHASAQRRLGRSETATEIAAVTQALRALHRERHPSLARQGAPNNGIG